MIEQKTSKTGRITIDTLAVMISKGFKEAHEDLRAVENRLDKRIDTLESRFDGLEQKMDFKFAGISNQIDNIYLHYTPRAEHTQLNNRVKKIERKVGIKQ